MARRNRTYYLDPANWTEEDGSELRSEIEELGLIFTKDAAVGEGAGGAGFETIIEFVVSSVAVNMLSSLLYDIAKRAWRRKPKRNEGPERLQHYRIVVHYGDRLVSIELRRPFDEIEVVIKEELPLILKCNYRHAYYNDGWRITSKDTRRPT